jgi:hypothetical protein
VKLIVAKWDQKCKSQIEARLDKTQGPIIGAQPIMTARNIDYEVSERTHAIPCGGIGVFHMLARKLGLIDVINNRLHLLKIHMPYHESDHVLNIAYNALCGGTCLQDLDRLRNDENYLNALGAQRIPDPTTAGDFCRRFQESHVETLIDAINDVRVKAWAAQPTSFFERATIDADGSLMDTTGACKEGMDISYKGIWGYHPLVVSLANTREVLSIVNRSGNRPSHEGAAKELDRAVQVCLRGGFRKVLLRGDTDFSQTEHLDGWNANPKIRFIFGYDAKPNLVTRAKKLPAEAWKRLVRPPRYEVKTQPRERPVNVKDQVVRKRGFLTLRLESEDVAEFEYRPDACACSYRMVVVRKNINKVKGDKVVGQETRYFFYISNEREWSREDVVFSANDRCDQENLVAQLKSGVRALHAPVNTLTSNWAYMVMVALSWNLKAWWALMLPDPPEGASKSEAEARRAEKQWVLRLEFKTFFNTFILVPAQIIRSGRKVIYRLLSWNPHLSIFFRLIERLRC